MADKTTIFELKQSAVNLIKSQKYSEALPVLQSILNLDPKNEPAWHLGGNCLVHLKKYPEAIDAFNQALKINQNNSLIWNHKGCALFELGKYSEAIDAFTQALGISPNDETIKNNKEFALEKLNAQNEQSCLKKSNDSNARDLNEKGAEYFKQNKYAEAITSFDQALRLNPNDETIKNNREIAIKKLELVDKGSQEKLGKPVKSAPILFTFWGIGAKMWGDTYYFTICYLPILPIKRYFIDPHSVLDQLPSLEKGEYTFYGELELHPWQKTWQFVIIGIFIGLIIALIIRG